MSPSQTTVVLIHQPDLGAFFIDWSGFPREKIRRVFSKVRNEGT
jgi:hypothetical protein